jgi:hypothetical protein
MRETYDKVRTLVAYPGPSSFPRNMSLKVVFQICFGSIKMMGMRGVLVPHINNKDKINFNLMFLRMLFIINKVNVKVPDLITLVNIVYCSKFHLGMAIESSMWSL